MAYLRQYIWLWVIAGVIFISVLISFIFFLINKCISRSGKHRISQLQRKADFSVNSNKYMETNLKGDTAPPMLPPRTQFLTADTQSYENLTEDNEQNKLNYKQTTFRVEQDDQHTASDYEQIASDNEQAASDYEQPTSDNEQAASDYEQPTSDNEQAASDYEQPTSDNEHTASDYEQCLDEQSDYVQVEEEEIPLSAALFKNPDPAADNTSTEDYDDIGGESQGEEDYDDVA